MKKNMRPTVSGKMISKCLVWFRNDLRFHDNEALLWAHENAETIVPVYCFDTNLFGTTHHFKFPKTGNFRAKFLLESVEDLRRTLEAKGSNLLTFRGLPETLISNLYEKCKFDALVFQKEVTKEETDVENVLEEFCKKYQIKVMTIWGSTLYHKDDLPFLLKSVPDTYTAFRKEVETKSKVRIEKPMPEKLKPLPNEIKGSLESLPTLEDLGLHAPELHPHSACPFSGGETAALSRIKSYFWDSRAIESYKLTRNGLLGSEYSTKLSPWLAFGCVSPRKIFFEVRKYEKERVKNDSTYWVIFELLWRDYFRFISAKYGNCLFYSGGIKKIKYKWDQDMIKFNLWAEGKTGVPFVDANMRELLHTGWMSNRGRQNVASFLTKDLHLDWRLGKLTTIRFIIMMIPITDSNPGIGDLITENGYVTSDNFCRKRFYRNEGAEWFEYLLTDYDVCSNYGNWNYSAGIGNDPREDRKFNMIKQGMDYDPEGNYVRTWIPELKNIKSAKVHVPWTLRHGELSGIKLGEDYPSPVVVAQEWSRHFDKTKSSSDWTANSRGKQKGIDFYFKSNSSTARR